MSSYTSRFIIPGRRAGNIKQIINNEGKCDTITTNIPQPFIITSGNSDCKCPQEINTKVVKSSNPDVDQTLTQNQRAVNAIRYSVGGRIMFGNNGSGVTFLGRTEGQPGGIKFSPKNKF